MRNLILIIAVVFCTVAYGDPGGTSVGGGGDATEIQIGVIRDNILEWIVQGLSQELVLPGGITHDVYAEKMISVLRPHVVIVGAVSTQEESITRDPERKVNVDRRPKTCRGFATARDGRLHILCNIERFKASTEDEQYELIHHEFAGLAGLERNQGASSDYEISKQVSGRLETVTVRRLPVSFERCQDLTAEQRRKLGQRCRTSTGAIWERAGRKKSRESWKLVLGVKGTEMDQGLIWSDKLSGLSGLYTNKAERHFLETQAWEACEDRGGLLPSKEEFERGALNGFREVLPSMSKFNQFWSSSAPSSTHPDIFAYVISGAGGIGIYHRYNGGIFSVRCVSRR